MVYEGKSWQARNNRIKASKLRSGLARAPIQAMMRRFFKKDGDDDERRRQHRHPPRVIPMDRLSIFEQSDDYVRIDTENGQQPFSQPQQTEGASLVGNGQDDRPPGYDSHTDFTETYVHRAVQSGQTPDPQTSQVAPLYDRHREFTETYRERQGIAPGQSSSVTSDHVSPSPLSSLPVIGSLVNMFSGQSRRQRSAQPNPTRSLSTIIEQEDRPVSARPSNLPTWSIPSASPSETLSERLMRQKTEATRKKYSSASDMPTGYSGEGPEVFDRRNFRKHFDEPKEANASYLEYLHFYRSRGHHFVKHLGLAISPEGTDDYYLTHLYEQFSQDLLIKCRELIAENPSCGPKEILKLLFAEAHAMNQSNGGMYNRQYLEGLCHLAYHQYVDEERSLRSISRRSEFAKMDVNDTDFLDTIMEFDPDTITDDVLRTKGVVSPMDSSEARRKQLARKYKDLYFSTIRNARQNRMHEKRHDDAMSEIMMFIKSQLLFQYEELFNDHVVEGLALRILFELREKR
ncbi:hypothetical protein [Aureibacter tunicatorum]|uniref:Uncharacterized protein n=1 Tax=Aureibacter tunicatorum TaxID=866807 RepID=A0AAE3XSX5_9BACT|nr:hypothetical protein [Aureibacter tunicatorum]MDR6242002.1 hypothetical protein [Aureibacter tunicatorum]BDD07265.1 hypothetical protein AUTU_47480 [Aureibacter tunicatorum]